VNILAVLGIWFLAAVVTYVVFGLVFLIGICWACKPEPKPGDPVPLPDPPITPWHL